MSLRLPSYRGFSDLQEIYGLLFRSSSARDVARVATAARPRRVSPSSWRTLSCLPQVRDVAPRPPNNPSIQIHRPSEGWIAQAHHKSESDLWATICSEARAESEAEPALASFLYASILSHKSIERSMAFILANKVGSPTLLSVHLLKLFNEVYEADPSLVECLRADMEAVRDRDPATSSYTQIMLFFKGYQAVQAYRIAHWLWRNGRRALAVAIQHRVSEIFHVDIHPAARIGRGILVDHATGVVIGETSVVGDNVSILHGVTLGGSGTGSGIRRGWSLRRLSVVAGPA